MLERSTQILLLGALALTLPACGYMSSSGRQQMAYAHYVRKMSHGRVKQTTKFKKTKAPKGQTSEPRITGHPEGPQSVTPAHAEKSPASSGESQPPPEPNGSQE
jgi:hypothetical protein